MPTTKQLTLPFYPVIGEEEVSKEQRRRNKRKAIQRRLKHGREASHLFTINAVSGGRSSAMMAAENPADMNIFALVQTDYPQYHFRDAGIRQYVWEKLQTDLVYATLESDETIRSIMELEQYIGQEIVMVCGQSMDKIIGDRKFLPNSRTRFCTSEMKIKPVVDFLTGGYRSYYDYPSVQRYYEYLQGLGGGVPEQNEPWIRMNIGYRLDDLERVATFRETYRQCIGTHTEGRHRGDRKWQDIHWRVGHFPIIEQTQAEVIKFWQGKPVSFPEFNNCEFCFNRSVAQLQKQFQERPAKGEFWIEMEKKLGATFRPDFSMQEIKELPIGSVLDYTAQSMCDTGGCTD